jgi:hypothetical protein
LGSKSSERHQSGAQCQDSFEEGQRDSHEEPLG